MKRDPQDYLKSPWRTIAFALSPYRFRFFAMLFCICIANILAYSLPYFFKIIADRVTQDPTNVTVAQLSPVLIALGLMLVAHEIAFRTGHIIETYIAPESFKFITQNLYSGLINRPTSYFENKFSGDLGKRITQVGEGVLYFIQMFPWEVGWVFFSLAMTLVLLATTHMYVVAAFLVWLVIFGATSIPLIRWHSREYEKVATAHAHLSGEIIDALANVPIIHSFGGASYEETLNSSKLDSLIKIERKVRWISVLNKFHQGLSIVVLAVGMALISIVLFARQEFTLGDFVLIAATIPSLSGVIWTAGDVIVRTSKQVGELTDAVSKLRDQQEQLKGGTKGHPKMKEYPVAFEKVVFQYPGTEQPVFNNFSLAIQQGEHVGIVGISGAGKSSLVKLLLRQYAAQDGVVAIGGTPIEQFTLETFNKLISYVPQDTSLFHRSLLENIAYANPSASKDEAIEASKQAHAHEFITKLPEGYDTKVGERGIKLSGGQRQRIALARAILKNAPILILDEATSSLDTESEGLIQEALQELFKHRTVIAIAHRLSTLRAMDRIVIMEDGTVVESGTPQELLASPKSTFKHMWEQQKNGFI